MSNRQNRTRIFENPNRNPNNQNSAVNPQSQRLAETAPPFSPNNNNDPQLQPFKQKPVLYFASLNTPKVPCSYHPDQIIQNFCKNLDCLIPLCPVCVKIHSDEHVQDPTLPQPQQFDLLESCLLEQYNKIVDLSNRLTDDISEICEFKNEIRNHREFQMRKLQEAKDQFYRAIESYFLKIENEINNRTISNTDTLLNETNSYHRALYDQWESFQRKLERLNSNRCLKTLIKSYKGNVPEDKFKLQHSAYQEFVTSSRANFPHINISHKKLNELYSIITDYLSIQQWVPVNYYQDVTVTEQIQQQVNQQTEIKQQQQQQQVLQPVTNQQFVQPQPRMLSGYPMLSNNPFKSKVIQPPQPMTIPMSMPMAAPNIMPVQQCVQPMAISHCQMPQSVTMGQLQPAVIPLQQYGKSISPQRMMPVQEIVPQIQQQQYCIPVPQAQPGMVINLNQSSRLPMAKKYHDHFNTIISNPNQPLTRSRVEQQNSDNKYQFSPRIDKQ